VQRCTDVASCRADSEVARRGRQTARELPRHDAMEFPAKQTLSFDPQIGNNSVPGHLKFSNIHEFKDIFF